MTMSNALTEVQKEVQALIEKGRVAQQEFETWSQEKVDEAVRVIGKAVYDDGDRLAKLAAEETQMGRYEDKILKNKGKSKAVWNKLKHQKSRNIIRYIEDEGLIEVAKPMGVIGAVTPTTNPTMTPMQNAMIALKGGNALLVSPHPRGKQSGVETVKVMREALKAIDAPEDLIQIIPNPTLEHTQAVMAMCDVTIATGGPSMVKAAYSSGKPSFGVGAGNIQCLADTDVAAEDYLTMVVNGRIYDNGVLCTCEQCLIYPKTDKANVEAGLIKRGGYLIKPEEMDSFRDKLFPNGVINKDMVGRPASEVAELGGLTVPEGTKFIFVQIEKYGADELFTKEKLCPVLATIGYDTWEEAITIAKTNLLFEGAGHSAVVHSHTTENIEAAGKALPVSRVAVNQQGSSGLGGAMNNGLNPTGTLGCGSWGNNSISENLWWTHLVNISRVAYVKKDAEIPTDDEIWNS
ncbi:succinate-semialdehyde dehydrogenase [Vagococcus acidifermentans]|uniref:Succinate-semialdehyde dehydrogenase n=2 Tax=Vagococcus acidifermentans TaxID=564710 RepID=A0A430B2S7_9ENTE|nr:succinate-semialdehyde dehydrogenase [Vagococcus acidifermentans]